eukprot:948449-Heterocapsa_arctica.AAC.1
MKVNYDVETTVGKKQLLEICCCMSERRPPTSSSPSNPEASVQPNGSPTSAPRVTPRVLRMHLAYIIP